MIHKFHMIINYLILNLGLGLIIFQTHTFSPQIKFSVKYVIFAMGASSSLFFFDHIFKIQLIIMLVDFNNHHFILVLRSHAIKTLVPSCQYID